MKVKRLRSWKGFKELIHQLVTTPPDQRAVSWFRGQGDANWPLSTALDRHRLFQDEAAWRAYGERLLAAFRQEVIGLRGPGAVPEGVALELLARHHGLPSDLMDWTESPYVAAYFAFQGVAPAWTGSVAVWALNRGRLPEGSDFEPIQDRELLWYNPRALSQRGVFLRIRTVATETERLLGDALTKMTMPSSEAVVALRGLEAMNITARNLFRDLEGAARSAISVLRLQGD